MSDIIILNTPKIDTLLLDNEIALLNQKTIVNKDYIDSSYEVPNITGQGNFCEWEIQIFQTSETDAEWKILTDTLIEKNTGGLFDFYPDTVNNPTTKYKSWFFAYPDNINDNPIQTIYCKIMRFYSNGNEA